MWKWFEALWEARNTEAAWKNLFPNKPLNTPKIARWNSRIQEKIELFMAIESFKKEPFLPKLFLNRFSLRRSPNNCFHDTIRKSRNQMAKQPIRDHSYYVLQHELDRLELEYHAVYPSTPIRRHKIDPQEIEENYKLSLLLQQIEVILNRIGLGNPPEGKNQQLIGELEDFVSDSDKDFPVALLFLKLYEAYTFEGILSQKITESLLGSYFIAFKHLRPDAQYSVFINIYNCLIRSQNGIKDQSSFHIEKLLELCDWFYGKRKDIRMRSDSYSNHTKIYLSLADKSEEEAEAEKFIQAAERLIESTKYQLAPSESEDVFLYNKAMLLFARFQFDEIEKLANQVYRKGGFTNSNIHQEFSFDFLHAKSLYELGKREEELLSLLKSIISKASASKKLSTGEREFYLNRARFFRQVAIAKSEKKVAQLSEKVLAYKHWLDFKWFVQKLREKKVSEY
ncbi:MAG: hypothetical protein AAF696_13590 [Bacteroidota bacterium]